MVEGAIDQRAAVAPLINISERDVAVPERMFVHHKCEGYEAFRMMPDVQGSSSLINANEVKWTCTLSTYSTSYRVE